MVATMHSPSIDIDDLSVSRLSESELNPRRAMQREIQRSFLRA